jgi:V8-like Glu-specific endopeptidase
MYSKVVFLFLILINANYLLADRLVLVSASYGKNIIAITEANGNVIWSYKTAGQAKGHAGHHDVHMLSNGNILFHETWQDVKEITLGKKIVMDYDCAIANGNKGKRVHVHAFSRLANGHTQIVESGVGRVLSMWIVPEN